MFRSILLISSLSALSSATLHPKIDDSVRRNLAETNDVMVVLKPIGNRRRLTEIHSQDSRRGAKIQSRINMLSNEAEAGSKNVLNILQPKTSAFRTAGAAEQPEVEFNVHWITNQISVKGASQETLNAMAALDEVQEIRAPLVLPLSKPVETKRQTSTAADASDNPFSDYNNKLNQWNIEQIQAPKAWETFNNRGEGIIVANIDSGVHGTHEALVNSYVGAANNGWYDPYNKTATPFDFHSHGTHVMGLSVGSNGIGVAPGAKWMACKGCNEKGCGEKELIACAEFLACPHDHTGNKSTEYSCKTPHIINNSWGGLGNNQFYKDVVNHWRDLGIIPVFAMGNYGFDEKNNYAPLCNTADSPGDYDNVIAVGATTMDGSLALFSGKGPSVSGSVKPDISAPGHLILSAGSQGDNDIFLASGTSMAAPQVAGLIALMMSANESLEYTEIFKSMAFSAEKQTLVPSGLTCGGTIDSEFPNNIFGNGRINAYLTLAEEQEPESDSDSPTPVPVVEQNDDVNPAPTPDSSDDPAPGPIPAPDSPTPVPVVEQSDDVNPAPTPDSSDTPDSPETPASSDDEPAPSPTPSPTISLSPVAPASEAYSASSDVETDPASVEADVPVPTPSPSRVQCKLKRR